MFRHGVAMGQEERGKGVSVTLGMHPASSLNEKAPNAVKI
jgi:hypothetical protein